MADLGADVLGLVGNLAVAALRQHREAEIGIRLALGARRAQVVMLVMRQTVWMLVVGVPIGISLALLAGRSAGTLLFGVRPHDPPTLIAACLLLAVTAVAASLIPAWYASKVDPIASLRSQ